MDDIVSFFKTFTTSECDGHSEYLRTGARTLVENNTLQQRETWASRSIENTVIDNTLCRLYVIHTQSSLKLFNSGINLKL